MDFIIIVISKELIQTDDWVEQFSKASKLKRTEKNSSPAQAPMFAEDLPTLVSAFHRERQYSQGIVKVLQGHCGLAEVPQAVRCGAPCRRCPLLHGLLASVLPPCPLVHV